MIRSPIWILAVIVAGMAGDHLHWIGYVLAVVCFVLGVRAMLREIDEEIEQMRPQVLRQPEARGPGES